MAVKRVKFGVKTVSLRGNVAMEAYQHVHIELTADMEEGASLDEVVQDLSYMVVDQLKKVRKSGVFKSLNLNR